MSTPAGGSFGRRVAVANIDDVLTLEALHGKTQVFSILDRVLGRLLSSMIEGHQVIGLERRKGRERLDLLTLDTEASGWVAINYSMNALEERGSWFLPEQLSISGIAQFGYYFGQTLRFGARATAEASIKLPVRNAPHAIFVWALLEPAAAILYRPLQRAGGWGGKTSWQECLDNWPGDSATLAQMGIDVEGMGVLQPTRHTSSEQMALRQRILERLRMNAELGRKYRAYAVRCLSARYYEKADKGGQATQKRVLSKDTQPAFVGLFAGDWPAFVRYLGEELHGDDSSRAAVETTPVHLPSHLPEVDERISVAMAYWDDIGRLEASRQPGGASVWGLVDDTEQFIAPNRDGAHTPALYISSLPAELNSDIDRLWGLVATTKAPQRIVTAVSSHHQLAEAFGPALKVWHGIHLTAWFLTQGPYSRTDLKGLRSYYDHDLAELENISCPIPVEWLERIAEAQSSLAPPEQFGDRERIEEGPVALEVFFSRGTRRGGFERVRDLIAQLRAEWTKRNMPAYLERRYARLRDDLASFYYRTSKDRGKPPTPTQFAHRAVDLANGWLGGSVQKAYTAAGAPPQLDSTLVGHPNFRRLAFVNRMLEALSEGKKLTLDPMVPDYGTSWALILLANDSLRFMQVEEVLGQTPELKDIRSAMSRYARESGVDEKKAFEWYLKIYVSVRQSFSV